MKEETTLKETLDALDSIIENAKTISKRSSIERLDEIGLLVIGRVERGDEQAKLGRALVGSNQNIAAMIAAAMDDEPDIAETLMTGVRAYINYTLDKKQNNEN